MREVFKEQMSEMRQGWKSMSSFRKVGAIYVAASIATFMMVADSASMTTLTIVGLNAACCLLWIIRSQIRSQYK